MRESIKQLLPAKLQWRLRVLKNVTLFPFEPEIRLLRPFVTRDMAVVDVGANSGLYCAVLGKLAGRVFAFEPHPYWSQYLKSALPPNCHLETVALSDRAGAINLRVPVRITDGHERMILGLATIAEHNAFEGDAVAAIRSIPVEMMPMDDIEILGRQRIGFMKIDVEGHEMSVIRGAKTLIERDRPTLLIEIEVRHGADVPQLFGFFEERGYQVMAALNGKTLEPVSADMIPGLQSDEALQHRLKGRHDAGYVNNFFMIPG